MRLWNQEELGTSSSAFTFCAGPQRSAPSTPRVTHVASFKGSSRSVLDPAFGDTPDDRQGRTLWDFGPLAHVPISDGVERGWVAWLWVPSTGTSRMVSAVGRFGNRADQTHQLTVVANSWRSGAGRTEPRPE